MAAPYNTDIFSRRDKDVINAMEAADGDMSVAAKVLGLSSKDKLKQRIKKRPELMKLYGDVMQEQVPLMEIPEDLEDVEGLFDEEQATESIERLPTQLANEVLAMDTSLLQAGLEAAGIGSTTIRKIARVAEAQQNMAVALGTSLKWTNANASLQQTQMVELIEQIKANELNPDSPNYLKEPEQRLDALKLIARLSDSSMKAGDRVLQGNQILVKLMAEARKRGKGHTTKKAGKPGWGERR